MILNIKHGNGRLLTINNKCSSSNNRTRCWI